MRDWKDLKLPSGDVIQTSSAKREALFNELGMPRTTDLASVPEGDVDRVMQACRRHFPDQLGGHDEQH